MFYLILDTKYQPIPNHIQIINKEKSDFENKEEENHDFFSPENQDNVLSPKKFVPHSVLSTQSNTLEKIEETNEEDENLGEFYNHNLEIIEREELENDVFFFFLNNSIYICVNS
jgi:hypothetical protein